MAKLSSYFLLSPEDVGAERYSEEEISEMMKPTENIDDSALYEFARAVSFCLETDADEHGNEKA